MCEHGFSFLVPYMHNSMFWNSSSSNIGFFQIRKMDLEARNLQPSVRAGLLAKIREYKSDLNNLKGALKRITSGNAQQGVREELLESGMADALGVCYYLEFMNDSNLVNRAFLFVNKVLHGVSILEPSFSIG